MLCTSVEGAANVQLALSVGTGAADIPGHVFTGGMIAATVVSVAVLCLAVMCVIYRVDLVLCYRRWTGRDETLTGNGCRDAGDFCFILSWLNQTNESLSC